MSRVWVVGGTTFDLLASGLPRLPVVDSIGDEFTDQSLVQLPSAPVQSVGGNAANAAYVLGRLGVSVHVCTSIGDDPLGRALQRSLHEAGCEVTLIPPRETSVNFVATDESGGRRSFFFPVALDASAASRLSQTTPFAAGDHVALTGYPHPEAEVLDEWAHRARTAGASVSLDIGPASAGFRLPGLLPILDQLDILFCNERELAGLDPARDAERVADDMVGRLRVGLVVKKGFAGAEFHGRAGRFTMPAARVECDTTVGAGDAFDAGFIFDMFASGQDAPSCLRFATALVALILERGCGVSGAPTADEVAARLAAGFAEPGTPVPESRNRSDRARGSHGTVAQWRN